MPDAGDFERDDPTRNTGIGWDEAFAALPQQSPDAYGWQRLQARLPLPAARPRKRWPLWLATAASLVLAVAIPSRMLPRVGAEAATGTPVPQASASPAWIAATPVTTPAAAPVIAIATQPAHAGAAARARTQARLPPSQRPLRTAAQPPEATRIAAANAGSTDLEPLYAQSARFESLLAMARDERVASGTSAALSSELDARVAAIDATLTQTELSDARRADLWGQRVDALQQLVGIEATNRLYAARGRSYDAALVSID